MKPRTLVVLTILVSVLALGLSGAHAQTVLYVDDDAPLGGDGASWSSPFKYLQDALAAASADPTVSEIRVAGGVYKPDQDVAGNVTPGDREATLQLLNGVSIYGGHAGLADPGDPDERDITARETILSGDLARDDVEVPFPEDLPYEPTRAENSRHVVTGSGTDETVVVDGFIITGGNADGVNTDPCPDVCGGGMLSVNGSPTFKNCTFGENSAVHYGGGVYYEGGSPTFTNCTFLNNHAVWHGGGARIDAAGKATMIDCVFSGNSSIYGGGLMLYAAEATLTRCTFMGNRASDGCGGAYVVGDTVTITGCVFSGNDGRPSHGGGVCLGWSAGTLADCLFADNVGSGLLIQDSYPTITNCTFLRNSARHGGGIWITGTDDIVDRPLLTNCVFSGNQAETEGGGVYLNAGRATFVNCTLSGNVAPWGGGMALGSTDVAATVANCVLWGNSGGDGNLQTSQIHLTGANTWLDINYSDVQGWTGNLGGVGNFGANPLFIDADGEDDIVGTEDDDLRLSSGSPCIDSGDNSAVPADAADLDGDGDTTEPTPLDLDWLPRFVDDLNTPDTGVGTPGIPEIVDMGAYEYQDCNENGENDVLDVAETTSDDCNENLVPDECEEDSDGDEVIDECESCPDDPDKVEPGVCGCGVPDNDTDGDGTEDCNDGCPEDPAKVEPGVCGCGVPEDDTDDDTVPDCIDQCPGQDDRVDENQDATPDCLEPEVIPTVSLWGAAILGLLLLAGGKIGFGRRRRECGVS